ncbi:hypothetical protein [Liquorilactobacillus mali]|uniref:Uncharacterized protein n=1 Tax=Liquorilactobacillus mali KCTC 3596 = DSM 20444 TaxID=1046596 RepID=A0A0R2EAJ4_9LACO|nr:hypothetical protein [Liquorilactobacillus mali]KRN09372.1 hypothetical protein FD00_GL001095 [Liquorilactobacillus mali KCTC 3596 = DSM 20444]
MIRKTLIPREEFIARILNDEDTYSFNEAIGLLAELKPDPEKLFFEGEKTTQLMWSDYHKCVTVDSMPLDYDTLKTAMPLSDIENPWTAQRIGTQEEIEELMKDPAWIREQAASFGACMGEVMEQNSNQD